MNKKIDISFTCHLYTYTEGQGTMFLFWPYGEWDENKYTLTEAIKAYPPSKYEWLHTQ